MPTIRLVHWNEKEGAARAAELRRAGYRVAFEMPLAPELLRALTRKPPAAIVIDLTRLPSHGMHVGLALRGRKSTRHIPLVFAGGEPEKVERIRKALPDAPFVPWSRIRSALKQAMARPLVNPVVPASVMAGYSGTPLPAKLGIKPGSRVVLLGAPPNFRRTLGALPDGAELSEDGAGELFLWFVRSREELGREMKGVVRRVAGARVWIAWPKKTSPLAADVAENDVRELALAAGLVDYKVCAMDNDWSGLLFVRKKK